MQQSLVHRIRLRGVRAGTSRNGFDALALPISEQPHGVNSKGTPAALLSQDVANPSEILLEPLNPASVHEGVHRLTH